MHRAARTPKAHTCPIIVQNPRHTSLDFADFDFVFPPAGGKTLRGYRIGNWFRLFLQRFFRQSEEDAACILSDCRKTMKKTSATEQRGKCEGGKKPPSRSIKRFSELFEVRKTARSVSKRLFRHAARFLNAAGDAFCLQNFRYTIWAFCAILNQNVRRVSDNSMCMQVPDARGRQVKIGFCARFEQ